MSEEENAKPFVVDEIVSTAIMADGSLSTLVRDEEGNVVEVVGQLIKLNFTKKGESDE